MQVQLLVSADCPPCRVAEVVWCKACAERDVVYERIDLGSAAGERLRTDFGLRTLPAVLVDGKLVAIGVQTPGEVAALLDSGAPPADP